jgi:hypothetical protein
MLNVLVPQIILNSSRITPPRREVIPTRMPQLVRMGDKGQPCHPPRSRHNLTNRPRRQGGFALGHEHRWGVGVDTLEFPQEAQLRTAQGIVCAVAVLGPVHIQIGVSANCLYGFEQFIVQNDGRG